MTLDDPDLVRAQYADEHGLSARRSVFATFEGVSPVELAVAAVAEARPRRVLEVGGDQRTRLKRVRTIATKRSLRIATRVSAARSEALE